MFLWNISLAFIWAAVTGHFTLSNVAVGMILGYAVLFVAHPLMGPSNYFTRIHHALGFAAFYMWQMIISNFRVAYDVLTPRARARTRRSSDTIGGEKRSRDYHAGQLDYTDARQRESRCVERPAVSIFARDVHRRR